MAEGERLKLILIASFLFLTVVLSTVPRLSRELPPDQMRIPVVPQFQRRQRSPQSDIFSLKQVLRLLTTRLSFRRCITSTKR